MSCDRCSDIHKAQLEGKNASPCRCECHCDKIPFVQYYPPTTVPFNPWGNPVWCGPATVSFSYATTNAAACAAPTTYHIRNY